MKLVSFLNANDQERVGLVIDGHTVDLRVCARELGLELPATILPLLEGGDKLMEGVREVESAWLDGEITSRVNPDQIHLLAPVPRPPSCRDAYAFRQHVATARRNRGVAMIPEFDQYPVFYFTNHNATIGEGVLEVETDHLQKLDFELEAAIVIGKGGKNIPAEEADSHIAGYTIMNDFSARVLQMEEMKLNLGPAKGKDFATAIGPWLVTVDELQNNLIETPDGNKYDLRMQAYHNGKQVSDGTMRDMNWTFAEIIERASYGVQLFPGDVIGSGTVGTGCFLELNGTAALEAKKKGEEFTPVWLQQGDIIELEIAGLGKLKHEIVRTRGERSILAKKKNVETAR